ncbi:endoribonuclease Dicer homolog 2 isoform X1 [Herrania umbratica]|uniref:Endoribonuclease Dicer homolog 2 isoform X1 n=1 Tax=Herrania umbratica TaxID=108875 RepID=A0A6J1A6K4_9ROSI|nr:endoribonuclease Dicer homolog 2 isoform X1 [Herrania umbratica]
MEPVDMEMDITQELSADSLPFARSYQLEALEKAIKQNTITYLETGSGKTLIAIMLLRSYGHLIRKPSPFCAVFLVPQVVLVKQQADAVEMHTDLNVGKYWGEMDVDFWDAAKWKQEIEKYEVLVMTPQILLNGLRHSFFKINMIKVLIIDECHHARGKHPYASIMTEFYHHKLEAGVSDLPRIFGMTASPIKSKAASPVDSYWQKIHELETIMNSKVYTCISESVLAQFVPFSTPKFRFYQHMEIQYVLYARLVEELNVLKVKHECSLDILDLEASAAESTRKKMSKIHAALVHCLDELGVWLALKAAEYLSCYESDFLLWGKLGVVGEKIVKNYSLVACQLFETRIPSGPDWTIANNVKASVDAGLLTTKVFCFIESLFEYRELKDIRCIIFVERVITAIVLQSLLSELLPKHNSWKTEYIAGNSSGLHSQTRKKQNEIVEEFRKGMVNIIVATSILEEGLDVQSCNLVIRFDPSATVCSFIQSRGRARMQNSDYLLLVKSGDFFTHSRLKNYLASGDIMRKESLCHASHACSPLRNHLYEEEVYRVASTGACVTLSSSVGLIHFYCSRLTADGYFKPTPRCVIDKEKGVCTLYLPKSCPIQTVCVQGNIKTLKQEACFEACKQLHEIGALTDNLVPDIVVEEADAGEIGREPYSDDQPIFFPPELVNQCSHKSMKKYYCYLIELKQNFDYEFPVHNIMLLVRSQLEIDNKSMGFELEVDRGFLTVNLKYVGLIRLDPSQVILSTRFQIAVFRVLINHKVEKLTEVLGDPRSGNNSDVDYLLLPSTYLGQKPVIDWPSVCSVLFSYENVWKDHVSCNAGMIQTKSGLLCACMIENSLVCTPHNSHAYIVKGFLKNLTANSLLKLRDGSVMTYMEYYELRHGIQLCFSQVSFLDARHVFPVHNYLHRCKRQKEKESSNAFVELPPELCNVIMSPISISTFYSFTFIPSIMYRLESLLLATNLKKMQQDHCVQNVAIPTMKVLEAITTKKCQENFHLESLETLGDSFLKYAVCQQLFKTHQNQHEGLLSIRKEKIISNTALCMLGCDKKLPGFIRNEPFDVKSWIIPGYNSGSYALNEETLCNTRKIYVSGRRKLKNKKVADVVEALIGAYLSVGGEAAGVLFLNWIGINVDFTNIPYQRQFKVHAEKLVNVRVLESLLNYSFQDPSLLVEALTHGSYMLAEIPECYQRMEFLGDSVLDYLITLHLYSQYPGMSPELLTDLRSASVNNDCYALSAVKAGLHKYILHASHKLHKEIAETVESSKELSMKYTFGWECEKSFPKVLADIIESLAGAIFVDSGYNKHTVFQSIRPLLEPLITPETIRVHPVKELNELCQKEHFEQRPATVSHDNGMPSITIEVEANGMVFKHTSSASNKKMAKKLACKEVLKSLKASLGGPKFG